MSTIRHVGSGPFAVVLGASLPVQVPKGWAANDLAFIHYEQVSNASAITTPAGWTLVARVQRSTTHVTALFCRKLQAGDATPTGSAFNVNVVAAVSGEVMGAACVVRGVDTTTLPPAVATSSGVTPGSGLIQATGPAPADEVTRQLAFVGVQAGLVVGMMHNDVWSVPGVYSDMDDVTVYPLYPNRLSGSDILNAYTDSSGGALAASYQDIPNKRATAVPFTFGTAALNYITHVVTLIAADQTQPPSVGTTALAAYPAQKYQLRGLCAQPPMRSAGVLLAPAGVVEFDPKICIQVAAPIAQDGSPSQVYSATSGAKYGQGWFPGERWVDITARVRGLSWGRGEESASDRDRTGVLTVTLDARDGAVSPFATSGAFMQGVQTWLRAGRLVRVAITRETTGDEAWCPLFTGRIETAPESTPEDADAYLTLTVVETTADLALDTRVAQTPAGAGSSLLVRAANILASSAGGWPFGFNAKLWDVAQADPRAVNATMQDSTLADAPLTELYLAADSDASRVLSDPYGSLVIAPIAPDSLTCAFVFANDPGVGELPIAPGTEPYSGNERILNLAVAARAGGTEQQIEDDVSIGRAGRIGSGYGLPRDDLVCQTDEQVAAILRRLVALHGSDDIGIASISLDADMAPDDLFTALIKISSRYIEDRSCVEVLWTHPTAGGVFDFVAYVAGITNNITMEGKQAKWTAQLVLAKAIVA